MKGMVIDFEKLIGVQDAEITPVVEQILENRNRDDGFDQDLEESLIHCLEEILEQRILQWEENAEMEYVPEEINLEEMLTYDIPKEMAEDLDSLAMDRIDVEKWMESQDADIWAKLEALDATSVRDTHEKILTLNFDADNVVDIEPELRMAV